MLYYGKYANSNDDILVMELLGPSLIDIMEQRQLDKLPLKTVLLLGIQMVCNANECLYACINNFIAAVSHRIHTQ